MDIKKDNSIVNPLNKKSSDLDENLQSNRSLKLGEISYREIDLKQKLNLIYYSKCKINTK